MGIHREASNRKTTIQRKKNQRTHRRKLKVKQEKRGGVIVGDVAFPELITGHMLSKRRTSPRANITLSGKKKRKLIKQLKHMATDKARDQQARVDTEMTDAPKEKRKNTKDKSEGAEADVEMADGDGDEADDQREKEAEVQGDD